MRILTLVAVQLVLLAPAWAHNRVVTPPHLLHENESHYWSRSLRAPPEPTKDQDAAWEYHRYGLELANAGWLGRAVHPIQRAIELDPENGAYHMSLANLYLDLDREQDAVESFRKAYKFGQGEVKGQAAYNLAYIGTVVPAEVKETKAGESGAKQPENAQDRDIQHWRREMQTTLAMHNYEYSRALANDGWLSRALGPLNRAIELDPDQGAFYLARGNLRIDLGKKEEAIKDFETAYIRGNSAIRGEAAYLLTCLGAEVPMIPKKVTTIIEDTEVIPAPPRRRVQRSSPSAGPTNSVGSANPDPQPAAAADRSLYDRLGGEGGVRSVVDDFVSRVTTNPRIKGRFEKTNLDNFKTRLVEQVGQATGGPQTYNGAPMRAAHRGMGIRSSEFNAVVDDLVASLKKAGVGRQEQVELLGLLSPMKDDIVEIDDTSRPK